MAARGVATPVPSLLCDAAQIPIDETKLEATPSEGSVDFCLNWLAGFVDRNEMCTTSGKWTDYSLPESSRRTINNCTSTTTELEALGVTVESWYGLMQGTCHLILECDFQDFSKELVESCNAVVQEVFEKYAQFFIPQDN